MKLSPGDIVFVDTNAIVAAHSAKAWGAIKNTFKLVTATLCTEEATQPNRHGEVLVDKSAADLGCEIDTRIVDDGMRFTLLDKIGDAVALDAGERDLLALVFAQPRSTWFLCGPDKATLRALHCLGWADKMIALEEMMQRVGVTVRNLDPVFSKRWLEEKRTRLKLGDSLI